MSFPPCQLKASVVCEFYFEKHLKFSQELAADKSHFGVQNAQCIMSLIFNHVFKSLHICLGQTHEVMAFACFSKNEVMVHDSGRQSLLRVCRLNVSLLVINGFVKHGIRWIGYH